MLLDNPEDDYKWFVEDEVGYMAELHRRDELSKKAFAEHMGPEFASEPKPLREDVEKSANHLSDQLAGLHRLNAPAELIEQFQGSLEELLVKLQKGEISTTKTEIEYYNAYYQRASEFHYEYK